jgi:hypothetical protein
MKRSPVPRAEEAHHARLRRVAQHSHPGLPATLTRLPREESGAGFLSDLAKPRAVQWPTPAALRFEP